MSLSSGQIKRLRAEGHRLKLKPVVIVGQKGLSENLHDEIEQALSHHEMIKMRIPALDKADKAKLAALICARHGATLVERIGSVLVIYRRNGETDHYGLIVGQ